MRETRERGAREFLPVQRWADINPREIFRRDPEEALDVERTVAEILVDVRRRGNEALREYTRRFDGVEIGDIQVPEEELERAYDSLTDSFQETLLQADARERFPSTDSSTRATALRLQEI